MNEISKLIVKDAEVSGLLCLHVKDRCGFGIIADLILKNLRHLQLL